MINPFVNGLRLVHINTLRLGLVRKPDLEGYLSVSNGHAPLVYCSTGDHEQSCPPSFSAGYVTSLSLPLSLLLVSFIRVCTCLNLTLFLSPMLITLSLPDSFISFFLFARLSVITLTSFSFFHNKTSGKDVYGIIQCRLHGFSDNWQKCQPPYLM